MEIQKLALSPLQKLTQVWRMLFIAVFIIFFIDIFLLETSVGISIADFILKEVITTRRVDLLFLGGIAIFTIAFFLSKIIVLPKSKKLHLRTILIK